MKVHTILTGIIGGGNLSNLSVLNNKKPRTILIPYGKVFYYLIDRLPLILRHGLKGNTPPHKINYRANIFAFKKLGVKFIFSFNSVGSLRKKIKPGNTLIPSDYIDFDTLTFYEKNPKFITPQISKELRKILIQILEKLNLKFFRKGVYFNTKGPRLETKAEINLIKNFADVVGMTMTKEATLANELDLEYASVCSVDNYAHGLIKKPLSIKDIRKNQARNKKNIEMIIEEILRIKI
jgi:5'-methylthioadenosine phosphorylase